MIRTKRLFLLASACAGLFFADHATRKAIADDAAPAPVVASAPQRPVDEQSGAAFDVVEKLKACVKENRLEDAANLLYIPKNAAHADNAKNVVAEMAERKIVLDLTAVDALVIEDAGAIIVKNAKKEDPDAGYVIKTADGWKLIPIPGRPDKESSFAPDELTARQKMDYEILSIWTKVELEKLKKPH